METEPAKRYKRGDLREDGRVFWCYDRGREYWVSPEKFAEWTRRRSARQQTDEYRERERAYRQTDERREYQRQYKRARLQQNPLFAAAHRLRNRTSKAFLRISSAKPANTEALLGTDWETVKAHIESQFVDGMSWENMGGWHIDHIVPLASAKTEEELCALCHYTNLQPLFALDNLRKGAKLPALP